MFYPSLPSALAAFSQWRAAVFAVLPRLQQIVCLPGEEPVAPASNSYGSAGMHDYSSMICLVRGKLFMSKRKKRCSFDKESPAGAKQTLFEY